ncbi:MAG: DUF4293 domain-containing protein, partial [Bacteroidales bacterium]|nr:DUF4293 domain-containing protein [Bacteroidales bacterium]
LVASFVIFFFPLARYLSDIEYIKLYIYTVQNKVPDAEFIYNKFFNIPLIVIDVAVMALILTAIFNYKKRLLQVKMVNFGILLNIVLIVLMFFYTDRISTSVSVTTSYETGSVFPLVCLVFLVLALRAIKRDEKLIRAADRLR